MTPKNTTPPWKSVADTGNLGNQVKSTQVAAAIGGKVDAVNGQSSGQQIAAAVIDPTSTLDGVTVSDILRAGGVDPVWYGAIGDGASHPASSKYATLADLQAAFPDAYSLDQELDFLALQAACSSGYGIRSPKRHYVMKNALTASDDRPLLWISGLAKGDFGLSNLDFSALKSVAATTEYCDDPNMTHGFSQVAGSSQSAWQMASYPPQMISNPVFGSGGCVYTDPASANIWQGTVSNGVLTVTGFEYKPAISVGDTVYTADWGWNLTSFKIVSFGTGTGGNGTYNIDNTTASLSTPVNMSTAPGHYTQFGKKMTLKAGTYKVSVIANVTEGASYANGNFQPAAIGVGFNSNSPGNGATSIANSLYIHPSSFFDGATQAVTLEFTFGLAADETVWFTLQVSGYCNVTFTKASITNAPYNCAVLATRDGSPEHYPQPEPISNVMITGPGNDDDLIGVFYNSYYNTDGTICNLSQVATQGFGVGFDFRNGAYLAEFWDCTPAGSRYAVRFLPGSMNAGENFRFFGGGMANGDCLIYNPGGAEFTLYSTTLDYSTQIVGQNAGRIELHGVHCECWGPSTQTPLFEMIDSGALIWFGGMILLAGDHTTYVCPPISLASTSSQFTMFGTQPYNLTCKTGMAISGPGVFRSFCLNNTGNMNMGSVKNFVNDPLGLAGDFEIQKTSNVCTDFLGIAGGLYPDQGEAMLDRWNSENFTMEWSTDFVMDGMSRSIKCTKAVAGKNHRLIFAVPVNTWQAGSMSIQCLFPYGPDGTTATTDNEPNVDAVIVAPGATAKTDGSEMYAIYARAFKVQEIGADLWGRPFYGPGDVFAGEADFHIHPLGSNVWKTCGFAPAYLGNPTSAASTDRSSGVSSPRSTTHMIMMLDTTNFCAGTFYIGGIGAEAV